MDRCDLCNKVRSTPYHITEIDGKKVESYDMCEQCANGYLKSLNEKCPVKKPDLNSINSPEDLLAFFVEAVEEVVADQVKEPCQCGMTITTLNKDGRFGCPNCYTHFSGFMKEMVHPFHKAERHVGKVPKNLMRKKTENDPVEKMKLLKLRYAKAIELEEYESASEINEEIKQLNHQQLSSSDQ